MRSLSRNLYLLNLALLITHEIDSAYWHEWELFGLPGGIQGFLAANLVLMLLGLWGFLQLAEGKPAGLIMSLVVAAGGTFAFCIHSYFILMGHPEFTLPGSLALLAAIMLVSVAQAALSVRDIRGRDEGEAGAATRRS